MKKLFSLFICLIIAANLAAQPIRLHPENPHYFQYNGKPTVLITSAEHYGAIVNPAFDYKKYLTTLAKDGLNYTRIFTGTYFERAGNFGIEKNTLGPPPGKILLPWVRSNEAGALCGGNKFNLEEWDENYFTRLKSFVSEAEQMGIIVEITLFSSIYGSWDIQVWNRNNNITLKEDISKERIQTLNNGTALKYQEKVVRKIVKELNEFDNVIYEIQNEPWADHSDTADFNYEFNKNTDFKLDGLDWQKVVEVADQASLNWQKKIASIITDEEKDLKNKHLIAQNYSNFFYQVNEVDQNVSILNFHYAYPRAVEINYHHPKVIGFDESGFTGSSDVAYRKQAWKFIIAGGGIFNNLDYSFTVGNEDGSAVNNAPGGGSAELRKQLKVLSDFFNSFTFIRMKPDTNTVVRAEGSVAWAFSETGKQYAIYISNGTRCKLHLNMPKGKYVSEWVNTLNGNVIKSETLKHPGGEITLNSPEYSDDIALKIVSQQKY